MRVCARKLGTEADRGEEGALLREIEGAGEAGTMELADGRSYSGLWTHGEMTGEGVLRFPVMMHDDGGRRRRPHGALRWGPVRGVTATAGAVPHCQWRGARR